MKKNLALKEEANILSGCKIKVIYGEKSLKKIVDEFLENVFEKEINKNRA